MNINGFSAHRRIVGMGAACLIGGGLAAATIAAPTASAAPDPCSADAVAATVSSVTGSAQQYLGSHPAANQVVTAAYTQPRPQAEANVRGYFTAKCCRRSSRRHTTSSWLADQIATAHRRTSRRWAVVFRGDRLHPAYGDLTHRQ
jgi:hemophore-related protein